MALTNRKRYANTAARRSQAPGVGGTHRPTSRTPITIVSVTFGTGTAVITFDQPITRGCVPKYKNDLGHLPTTAVVSGPNQITLTYPDATSSSIVVPFEDPCVRNKAGGYVLPGTFLST